MSSELSPITVCSWSRVLSTIWMYQLSYNQFLPEIKSDPCILAVYGEVHVKQVESHYCLPWAKGVVVVVDNVDVPIEL
jgi:hypothetical protein